MKKVTAILNKLLHPPLWVLIAAPATVFPALIFIFIEGLNDSVPAYCIYCLSAYCLTILIVPLPKLIKQIKSGAKQKITRSKFGERYISDPAFRASVGLYQGMAMNFLYVVFRIFAGIRYSSVWFITMAIYYLILGALRLSLIITYRHRDMQKEITCYRRTAWFLFILNIPMGGMITLMVLTDSGYSYPGYIIYISAMYTFYTAVVSVINIVKFRRLGSPVLSCAKVLNCVAAMMSVLGLQTAMITAFSTESDGFRRMMNAITGSAVWLAVIATAVYMLFRSRKQKSEVSPPEPFGK